jgi:hypothetical protein
VRTIKLEHIKYIKSHNRHAEERDLHYRAFTEVKGAKKNKKIFEICVFLCSNVHYIDASPDKLTCSHAHSGFTVNDPIADDLLVLSDC